MPAAFFHHACDDQELGRRIRTRVLRHPPYGLLGIDDEIHLNERLGADEMRISIDVMVQVALESAF